MHGLITTGSTYLEYQPPDTYTPSDSNNQAQHSIQPFLQRFTLNLNQPGSQHFGLFVCPPCVLQEALRLKEAKAVDEVIAVSLGPQQVQVRQRTVSGVQGIGAGQWAAAGGLCQQQLQVREC